MRPLYIFDLDGTLALIDHRRHFVHKCESCRGTGLIPEAVSAMFEGEPHLFCKGYKWNGPNWPAFFEACDRALPNLPVIETIIALANSDADIEVWSGRSDRVLKATRKWLKWHANDPVLAHMRADGDFTPDDVLKEKWLNELSKYDRNRLVAVFDDRDKVVAMWRRNGVACFQVAPGGF